MHCKINRLPSSRPGINTHWPYGGGGLALNVIVELVSVAKFARAGCATISVASSGNGSGMMFGRQPDSGLCMQSNA